MRLSQKERRGSGLPRFLSDLALGPCGEDHSYYNCAEKPITPSGSHRLSRRKQKAFWEMLVGPQAPSQHADGTLFRPASKPPCLEGALPAAPGPSCVAVHQTSQAWAWILFEPLDKYLLAAYSVRDPRLRRKPIWPLTLLRASHTSIELVL